jgi:hypothetical protein
MTPAWFAGGGPGSHDPVEVPGVPGDHGATVAGGGAQQLVVAEVGEGRVHGGGHDVVAVLAEGLGDEVGVVDVEEQLQPASRSCRRRHKASASSAAAVLAARSRSISSVNSA